MDALDEIREAMDKMQRGVDRTILRGQRLAWVNWYWNRGRIYGSGAMFRRSMRQASWRRAH